MSETAAKSIEIATKPQYSFETSVLNFCGYAAETIEANKEGAVCCSQFLTSYHGDLFYNILNSISSSYLNEWFKDNLKNESDIRNCMIIFTGQNSAKVYINIPTFYEIISKKDMAKNQLVTTEDIGDIRKVSFKGVDFDGCRGVIYIFRHKWMIHLYFNCEPLLNIDSTAINPANLEYLLATFHAAAIYPEVYRLNPKIKEKMFSIGWFPFIRILGWRFKEIFDYISKDIINDYTEAKVIDSFSDDYIHDLVDSWMNKDIFKEHEEIIKTGIDRFIEEDYISSIHVLYPRIEGLMRYLYIGTQDKSSQSKLADKLVEVAKENNPQSCLFLPDIFNEYLKTFYFKNFNLENGEVDLSRNTIGHGVVSSTDLNKIKAFQGILILDQIFFYI